MYCTNILDSIIADILTNTTTLQNHDKKTGGIKNNIQLYEPKAKYM